MVRQFLTFCALTRTPNWTKTRGLTEHSYCPLLYRRLAGCRGGFHLNSKDRGYLEKWNFTKVLVARCSNTALYSHMLVVRAYTVGGWPCLNWMLTHIVPYCPYCRIAALNLTPQAFVYWARSTQKIAQCLHQVLGSKLNENTSQFTATTQITFPVVSEGNNTWEWSLQGYGDILNAAIHHMMYCRTPGPLVLPHFGNIDLLPLITIHI